MIFCALRRSAIISSYSPLPFVTLSDSVVTMFLDNLFLRQFEKILEDSVLQVCKPCLSNDWWVERGAGIEQILEELLFTISEDLGI
jgi:hypothetical protein